MKGYVNLGPVPRVYPYIDLLSKLENIEIQTIEIKNEEKGNESGFWVFEAKHSIDSHKQLKIDFDQAKSYALILQCQGLCLISKEDALQFQKENESKPRYFLIKNQDTIDEIGLILSQIVSNL